jgi:hypothetical protein
MVKFVGLFFKYKKLCDARGYLTEKYFGDLITRINDLGSHNASIRPHVLTEPYPTGLKYLPILASASGKRKNGRSNVCPEKPGWHRIAQTTGKRPVLPQKTEKRAEIMPE